MGMYSEQDGCCDGCKQPFEYESLEVVCKGDYGLLCKWCNSVLKRGSLVEHYEGLLHHVFGIKKKK